MSITFTKKVKLSERYKAVRSRSEDICKPLNAEDYVVHPANEVSPPKWHLGHTTWFFENHILVSNLTPYNIFDTGCHMAFRAGTGYNNRANLSRPAIIDVYKYRARVDDAMLHLLDRDLPKELEDLVLLGLALEEQAQELLMADIKYILGHNFLLPAYNDKVSKRKALIREYVNEFIAVPEGLYDVGYDGKDFCFDNELGRHKVYLQRFKIAWQPVTNEEYIEFINDGGYSAQRFWTAEGFEWAKDNSIAAPMYWRQLDGVWYHYTMNGVKPVEMSDTLCHVSFHEATAFAKWKGMRLPTEFEWEAAANELDWGLRREWTNSHASLYPGYQNLQGPIAEFSSRFRPGQMVLRGASELTAAGHGRVSSRHFLEPHHRWHYTGIRLAK